MGTVARIAMLVGLTLGAVPARAQRAGPSAPVWRYAAEREFEWFDVTPGGLVLVQTGRELTALDVRSGQVVWQRDRAKRLGHITPCGVDWCADSTQWSRPSYLILDVRDSFQVTSLETGSLLWSFGALPLTKVQGWVPLQELGVVLVYGRSDESKLTVVAADLESGAVRWRQDNLFQGKVPDRLLEYTYLYQQPPYLDGDTVIVLFPNQSAPVALAAATGEVRWTAEVERAVTGSLWDRYARVLVVGDTMFVPYAKRIMALELRTGRLLWNRQYEFTSEVAQLATSSRGLVVRGGGYRRTGKGLIPSGDPMVDLLDPATGRSRWPGPFTGLTHASRFILHDDTVFVPVQGRLAMLALGGNQTPVGFRGSFTVEGDADPWIFETRDDDFEMVFLQHVIRLRRDGTEVYRRAYKPPGQGLLGTLFPGLREATAITVGRRYAYFYTNQPDATGREGNSLVKVDKLDGSEAGRIWFEKRSIDYLVSADNSTVVVAGGLREIGGYAW